MNASFSILPPISPIRTFLLDLSERGSLSKVNANLALFAQNLSGWAFDTPLLAAARTNPDPRVYTLLLGLGFSLTAKSLSGWSVLHELARRGWSTEIAATVRAGSPVEAPTDHGWTPLMLAKARRHTLAVQELLQLGARP